MAKINISLDLDWIGDDGSLDAELKRQIADNVIETITETEMSDIDQIVNNIITDRISERLNAYMEEFFDKPRNITDRWGEVIKENVTIKSQLSEALDGFIDQRVDNNGNVSNSTYDSKTRVQYMAEKYYKDYCSGTIERMARDTADTIKRLTEEQLSRKIGKKMADVIGLSEELGI